MRGFVPLFVWFIKQNFFLNQAWHTFPCCIFLLLLSTLHKTEVMFVPVLRRGGYYNTHSASAFTSAATAVVFNTTIRLSSARGRSSRSRTRCTVCGLTWRGLCSARLWNLFLVTFAPDNCQRFTHSFSIHFLNITKGPSYTRKFHQVIIKIQNNERKQNIESAFSLSKSLQTFRNKP